MNKNIVHVGFKDLEKAYGRINKEALEQVLKMYNVEGKLLGRVQSMYIDTLACDRLKGGRSKQFRIYSVVRQGCIMSP